MKKIYLLFLLFSFQTIQLISQNNQKYHRATISLVNKSIIELGALGIEVEHGDYQKGRSFTTDFSEYELNLIRQAGFGVEILIEDVSNWYKTQSKRQVVLPRNDACEQVVSLYNYPTPTNYTFGSMAGYYTYQEMLDILEDMHTKYPNLITLKAPTSDTILSHEGRPQYWVKISDNANLAETEPQIMYTALHHAREPNSLSQMIFYMWYLLENYNTDPEVQYIVNNLELYFVPCVNPDGYNFNITNSPDGGGLWRKNRRDNGDGTFGVDLNRNYGLEWGYNNQGSSPNSDSDLYRGPSAFSEPETRMLRDFCLAHNFKIALNYHTYSNLLIYPWGYSDDLADATFFELSKILTHENHYKTGTSSETVGYAVNGTADDWMYGGAQIFSMTPEVGPVSWGFWPPIDGIDFLNKSALEQNLVAAKCLLRFGEVKDNSTNAVSTLNNVMPLTVKRYGFESGVFQVNLIPFSANITSNMVSQLFDLQQFESKNTSIAYTLNPNIQIGDEIKFLLEISNGVISHIDTLTKKYSYASSNVLNEMGNNMGSWVTQNWNTTNQYFISAPSSITDSPDTDYAENQENTLITVSPISVPANANTASLSFQGRWLIEEDWDFVQVLVSTDQSNWTALCGNYTTLGINTQPANEPLFDGQQPSWVAENMDLSDYIGQSFWIQFKFVSDGFLQYDGFYFDDLVVNYSAPVGTKSIPLEHFTLSQNRPNPAQNSTIIDWTTPLSITESNANLLIYNALGQVIFNKEINLTNDSSLRIDTKNWQAGSYYYQIRNEKSTSVVKKLVKIN
jgi:carboxypeptidase T